LRAKQTVSAAGPKECNLDHARRLMMMMIMAKKKKKKKKMMMEEEKGEEEKEEEEGEGDLMVLKNGMNRRSPVKAK
jgi:hypothetical protein